MDINNLAAWDKFAKSGKIDDYLQYRHSLQESNNADKHGRTDNKGAQNKR